MYCCTGGLKICCGMTATTDQAGLLRVSLSLSRLMRRYGYSGGNHFGMSSVVHLHGRNLIIKP